jgi:type VI secretion system protein ImpF
VAGNDPSEILRPSVLDRLMKRPEQRNESAYHEGVGLRELKQAVARDLAWLLNTRMWMPEDAAVLAGLEEAHSSVLTYGIPDLSIFSWASPDDCKKIAALVEKAIRTFEPRLIPHSVRCDILPSEDSADFSVKLRIDAILHVEPVSEHVTFDSVADFDGGSIRVETFE